MRGEGGAVMSSSRIILLRCAADVCIVLRAMGCEQGKSKRQSQGWREKKRLGPACDEAWHAATGFDHTYLLKCW
jgi:hypothetical protein